VPQRQAMGSGLPKAKHRTAGLRCPGQGCTVSKKGETKERDQGEPR